MAVKQLSVQEKRIKKIQHQIDLYKVKPKIANVMLDLGNLGFEFSGHGHCLLDGTEDFSLTKEYGNKKCLCVAINTRNKCYLSFMSKHEDVYTVNVTLSTIVYEAEKINYLVNKVIN